MLTFIKLDINIHEDDKMLEILEHEDGHCFVWLWIGLLCLAMKSPVPGFLLKAMNKPHTMKSISNKLRISQSVAERGFQIFNELDLIDTSNGAIEIINFQKWQNTERIERQREISRQTSKKYRDKQRKLLQAKNT
jgi:hypothetical protein